MICLFTNHELTEGGLMGWGRRMDSTALTVAAMKKRDELRLTRQDVARAYKDALRAVSVMRGSIPDETRQLMADAVREFYRLLEERIEAKRDRGNVISAF